MEILPVGVNFNDCITDGSTQVTLAPVSINARIVTNCGISILAEVNADLRSRLTPMTAVSIGPCGVMFRVKCGTYTVQVLP
jgi:hypothetical protein